MGLTVSKLFIHQDGVGPFFPSVLYVVNHFIYAVGFGVNFVNDLLETLVVFSLHHRIQFYRGNITRGHAFLDCKSVH